jgi:hypothetical protein
MPALKTRRTLEDLKLSAGRLLLLAYGPPPMADEEAEKPADETAPQKSTEATPDASAPPRKKKKKKKKRAAETSEATEDKSTGPVLGPEGSERPNFVLDFPENPELERLVRAFELGNYAFVREHATKLSASSSDDAVKRAAGELLHRIEPDPLVKILLAMSVALLAFMVFYAYRSHGH